MWGKYVYKVIKKEEDTSIFIITNKDASNYIEREIYDYNYDKAYDKKNGKTNDRCWGSLQKYIECSLERNDIDYLILDYKEF